MKKAIKGLKNLQVMVAAVFLFIFLMTVVIQMATRFMGIAATWTEVDDKRHFAFTSFYDKLKNEKAKSVLQIVIDIVMLIFSVLMLVYGIQITKQFWNYTWTNIPSFKRGPTWMCLPICGGTASIYLVYQIYEEIMKLVHGGKA